MITSDLGTNGKIITFSFQIEASDQIKCYMYLEKQCIRFYPQDIILLFCHIFTKQQFNSFSKGFESNWERFYDSLSKTIKDSQFEAFYNSLEQRDDNNKLPIDKKRLKELLEGYSTR